MNINYGTIILTSQYASSTYWTVNLF